ncbi:hypothetical protein EJ08DRAFT_526176 [Tothia fuscella]|uniref:Histidine kinase n=1 Tax=Tothia fuscella TaxID=1048955 RepID=A0A9P4TU07_9PEZI|nr:hypothetical protein EJ08DRAFT_526176 [Tothia fuscella]
MAHTMEESSNFERIEELKEDLINCNDDYWIKSPLGDRKEWHPCLKSFANLIPTLPHPAAIYWGEDLLLLYNNAWRKVAPQSARQGEAQHQDHLTDIGLTAMRTVMHGSVRRNLAPAQLLGGNARDGRHYNLLLSPITLDDTSSQGVLAQLFPAQDMGATRPDSRGRTPSNTDAKLDGAPFPLDDLPLDEHPFFQRFAAMLPTGLAILNHKAEAIYVNKQFFELTTHRDNDKSFRSWPQTIHADDHERVMKAYQDAFNSGEQLTCEFRTQGHEDHPWRLLLLTPLGDDNLRHASLRKYGGFICAIIDITDNKKNELAQEQAARDALERKNQQERFIDMISHEIRNPLSAVLHCTEDIIELVENGSDGKGKTAVAMFDLIEAADTIKLCVNHQRHIVDDILSFSKLDASMLSLTPRSVRLKKQLADSLKMFQPEFRKQHMEFEYKVDHSYDDNHIDFVQGDIIRISQVLVNLVTNSIKFTAKKEGQKKISVALGASTERPTSYPPNVVFFDTDDSGYRMDGTNTSEWGNGEAIYILVAVMDTGIGISEEGQRKLFERFRQATPKTEEIYGGSGLGLNISRKICQLHGGEIGCSSILGEGSTFGFFFKVRRTENPPKNDQLERNDLQRQLEEFADGEAPISRDPGGSTHPDLENPPTERVVETGTKAVRDDRYKNTARIAESVDQKSPHRHRTINDSSETEAAPPALDEPSMLEKLQNKTDSDLSVRRLKAKETNPKTQVLLVEDNVINQRILKRKLEAKGFDVTVANNGREAVDTVHRVSEAVSNEDDDTATIFDVILMDQEMPVLDGNSATKKIRELEAQGLVLHVPILGVTANVREEQKADMMSAGMDDVISKPYGIEEMVERIKKLTMTSSGS